MNLKAYTILPLLAVLFLASCGQEDMTPREFSLVSKSGYILAPSAAALHEKVIGELQTQFGLNEATLIDTKIKEHEDYVLALIEFVTGDGEDGNMLFIIHRNGDYDREWTKASKYSTLACSGSLGCKLEVYEDEEEIAYLCNREDCGVEAVAL